MGDPSQIFPVEPVIEEAGVAQGETLEVYGGGSPAVCKGRNYLVTCGRTLRRNQKDPKVPHGPIADCAPHGGNYCVYLPDLPPGGYHLPPLQVRGIVSLVKNSYSCD